MTKIRIAFYILITVLTCENALAQYKLKSLAKLPEILKESSGLEITGENSIWTHNDSRISILYCIDTTGAIQRAIHLNHPNVDWEDLTKDNKGNFYIGDFGNNRHTRNQFKIYKIPPPDSISAKIINAESIIYSYSDLPKELPPPKSNRNFDVESLISMDTSLYLFTKNWTVPYNGYTKLYRLPQDPGKHVAQLVDSVYLGPGAKLETWVTGAAISPDNKKLALLSHNKVWLFTNFEGDNFFKGKLSIIRLDDFSQKEGICFINNDQIYITDELTKGFLGGNLYKLDLPSTD